jgi:uncharacterized iron-regulated membrane protein
MRLLWRLTKVFALFAILLLVLVITGASSTLVFYARVAKLYTQNPDTKLAMPLENVAKRAIADTWQAPRGTDRRHEGQDIFAPRGTPILSATRGIIFKIGENNLGGQTVSVIGSAVVFTTTRTSTRTRTESKSAIGLHLAPCSVTLAPPVTHKARRRTCISAFTQRPARSIPCPY